MSIQVVGPDWPSTARLRERLAASQATGIVRWGGGQDKLEQLKMLAEAGVPCVEASSDRREVIKKVWDGEMWWGRMRKHSQGTDIQLPWRKGRVGGELRAKWLASEYWVKFVPSVAEWRIHIVDGRSVARGMKVQSQAATRVALVRSRRNGWHMAHGPKPSDEMRAVAKRACKATGLDVGAVDLLVKEDGGVVVLEVNTACALLDDYTLEAYARAFERRFSRGGHLPEAA